MNQHQAFLLAEFQTITFKNNKNLWEIMRQVFYHCPTVYFMDILNEENFERCNLGAYSQHFILFVTQVLGQQVRVFVTGKPVHLRDMEQSNLLGQFVSYEENGMM